MLAWGVGCGSAEGGKRQTAQASSPHRVGDARVPNEVWYTVRRSHRGDANGGDDDAGREQQGGGVLPARTAGGWRVGGRSVAVRRWCVTALQARAERSKRRVDRLHAICGFIVLCKREEEALSSTYRLATAFHSIDRTVHIVASCCTDTTSILLQEGGTNCVLGLGARLAERRSNPAT